MKRLIIANIVLNPESRLFHEAGLAASSRTPVTAATTPPGEVTYTETGAGITLGNPHLHVVVNSDGQVTSAYDKRAARHLITPGETANQLIAFEDRPICWDAWDIDASYEERSEIV